jgi:hypothetical protein
MDRRLRRLVLSKLFEADDEQGLTSVELLETANQHGDDMKAQDLKVLCKALGARGELTLKTNPGDPEFFAVELTPMGSEAVQDLNYDDNLCLDILWVLNEAKRGRVLPNARGISHGMVTGEVPKRIAAVLPGTNEKAIAMCLREMHGTRVDCRGPEGLQLILSAEIRSEGQRALKSESPNSRTPQVHVDKSVNITAHGSIVNYQSDLVQVAQTIGGTDLPNKDELAAKLRELEQVLKALPEEHQEDAESVADAAKSLVKEASKTKPVESRMKVTAEGLKEAAGVLASISPQVAIIVAQIITLVMAAS